MEKHSFIFYTYLNINFLPTMVLVLMNRFIIIKAFSKFLPCGIKPEFVCSLWINGMLMHIKKNMFSGLVGQNNEVSDLCRMLIGKWAEIVAKIFSLIVLIGANIVYWILMSNFLFNSVQFLHGRHKSKTTWDSQSNYLNCRLFRIESLKRIDFYK